MKDFSFIDLLILIALIFIFIIMVSNYIEVKTDNPPQQITVKCALDIPTTDDIPALKIGE